MIKNISFDFGPMLPGETRELRVYSTTDPITISIQCFREPPTPAQLTACQECGSYSAASGDAISVTASSKVFRQIKGFLRIVVRDTSNDVREFMLLVSDQTGVGGAVYVTR